MSDGFRINVETAAVVAALLSLGDAAQPYVNDAAHESAASIAREAQARLQRKLGPKATGATVAGIHAQPAADGNGSVVISGRDPKPNLPLWLEKGTRGGHVSPALAYFYSAAQLEEGPHFRRIQDAVAQAIADKGLGE